MEKYRQVSSREDKVAWLLAHRELWEGLALDWGTVVRDPEQLARIRELAVQIRHLYSTKTSQIDIEFGVWKLVQAARKVRRGE